MLAMLTILILQGIPTKAGAQTVNISARSSGKQFDGIRAQINKFIDKDNIDIDRDSGKIHINALISRKFNVTFDNGGGRSQFVRGVRNKFLLLVYAALQPVQHLI